MRNLKSFLKIQNYFYHCDENALKILKNIQKRAYIFFQKIGHLFLVGTIFLSKLSNSKLFIYFVTIIH